MNATHDDAGMPSSIATMLRSEARSTRPEFSDAFHARLIECFAKDRGALPSRDQGVAEPRSRWLGRFAMPLAAVAAFAAAVAVLVTARGPGEAPNGSLSMESAGQPSPDGVPELGVDSLPLFDDIDADMRAGLWMLASSLVEMPDWVTLADFDAGVESRDAQGP